MSPTTRILIAATLCALSFACRAQYTYSMGSGAGWTNPALGSGANGTAVGNRGTFGTTAGSPNAVIGNGGTFGTAPGTPNAASSNAGTIGTTSLNPIAPVAPVVAPTSIAPVSGYTPIGASAPVTGSATSTLLSANPIPSTPPVVIQFAPPVANPAASGGGPTGTGSSQ
ncbi:MAG TPA: hypothetical protein VFB08_19125 [Burkholderiales bacterium]|nr:hypothetical protein [Burkholderiales bacterium]